MGKRKHGSAAAAAETGSSSTTAIEHLSGSATVDAAQKQGQQQSEHESAPTSSTSTAPSVTPTPPPASTLPTTTCTPASDSAHIEAIHNAIKAVDLPKLRQLSVKGYVNNQIRSVVWPLLLNVDVGAIADEVQSSQHEQQWWMVEAEAADQAGGNQTDAKVEAAADGQPPTTTTAVNSSTEVVAASSVTPPPNTDKPSGHEFDHSCDHFPHDHTYSTQIDKDVNRSLTHFSVCTHFTPHQTANTRHQLAHLMHQFFTVHAHEYHYTQGFHDICSVLLLVLEDVADETAPTEHAASSTGKVDPLLLTYHCLNALATTHLHDHMQSTLTCMTQHWLPSIYTLLAQIDPAYHRFLLNVGCIEPHFALSWVLTYLAHNLSSLHDIAHIYDYILASHPSTIVYLSVAVLLQLKSQLNTYIKKQQQLDVEIDFTTIHAFFQDLSQHQLNVPQLILRSAHCYQLYPAPWLLQQLDKQTLPADCPLRIPDTTVSLAAAAARRLLWRARTSTTVSRLVTIGVPLLGIGLYAANVYWKSLQASSDAGMLNVDARFDFGFDQL